MTTQIDKEVCLQLVGTALVFGMLNLVVLKDKSFNKRLRVAYVILANTGLLVLLMALHLPPQTQFVAAAMCLSAVGIHVATDQPRKRTWK